jgi:hypothetical protein
MIGYTSKEIEASFKEELNHKRSDIYEIYLKMVQKILLFGKEKTMAKY